MSIFGTRPAGLAPERTAPARRRRKRPSKPAPASAGSGSLEQRGVLVEHLALQLRAHLAYLREPVPPRKWSRGVDDRPAVREVACRPLLRRQHRIERRAPAV